MALRYVKFDAGRAGRAVSASTSYSAEAHELAQQLTQHGVDVHADWDAGTYDTFVDALHDITQTISNAASHGSSAATSLERGIRRANDLERERRDKAEQDAREPVPS